MRISDWSSDVCSSDLTPFVARLKQAGAVLLGKTTTSELGWTGVSRSPLTGIPHNPWRHGHNAGASSAGAGAAAAAGLDGPSVVEGQSVSVRVDHGGRSAIKKNIRQSDK